jgi:prepilin-type N-terminal cleavage/methylation domain-containing protein
MSAARLMISIPGRLRLRLRDERGFSLIEVLVAMVAGIIVTGALFAILEISLKQNSRITDRVQAQQLGDNAMTRIIDPLRSGCISREATPVLKESTPTKVIFTTAYSEATTPADSEVFKDTIEYSSTTHQITAKTQQATAGTWPTYTAWETPGKTTLIAENVYLPSGHTYFFKYFKYGTEATSSTETGESTLEELKTTGALTEAEAKTVAGVEVNFETLGSDNYSALNRGAQFNDRVTFAFSTPNSEGSIKDAPCE